MITWFTHKVYNSDTILPMSTVHSPTAVILPTGVPKGCVRERVLHDRLRGQYKPQCIMHPTSVVHSFKVVVMKLQLVSGLRPRDMPNNATLIDISPIII
jgi:hypothetical protein